MRYPSAPDPNLDIPAIRVVAHRVALMLAKGIGEPAALREAVALVGGPCAKSRRLAKQGGKMAVAVAKARALLNSGEPVPQVRLPSSLLATLTAPVQPADQQALANPRSACPAAPLEAPWLHQRRTSGEAGKWSAHAESVRGNLRLILGGAGR